jgi:hypothetical protein
MSRRAVLEAIRGSYVVLLGYYARSPPGHDIAAVLRLAAETSNRGSSRPSILATDECCW